MLTNQHIVKTGRTTHYHRLSNNISDEARIPQHEIESLANYVWLRVESTKRSAEKERIRLKQEIETTNPEDNTKIDALKKQIKEQIKMIQKCNEQQTEGYLAYVFAKTDRFSSAQEKTAPFVMPKTTLYGSTAITPYWPISEQSAYQPMSHTYEVLNKLGVTTMEPGKFYLKCDYNNAITYTFVNPLGEQENESIWDINDIVLEKDTPLSLHALKALKERILKHATGRGHTPSIVGTLADLQKLTQESATNDVCQHACNQLSLDMSNALLFAHLKYYFHLINDNQAINDPSRAKLKDFCQRTLMACADLNERLKDPEDKMARDDPRSDRLQIAIVLLRGLENPALFREAFTETIKEYSWNEKNLEKYSIWKIISNDKKGFYSKFSIDMPFISLVASSHQKEVVSIKKISVNKPLQLTFRTKLIRIINY